MFIMHLKYKTNKPEAKNTKMQSLSTQVNKLCYFTVTFSESWLQILTWTHFKELFWTCGKIQFMLEIALDSLLSFCLKAEWRRWPTGCQRGAASSWSHAHITLQSCWSTSHLAWSLVVSLWPGGLWSFMCCSTRLWQGSWAMSCTSAGTSPTQSVEEPSCLMCSESFLCI